MNPFPITPANRSPTAQQLILIGAGEFGRQILETMQRTAGNRPSLTNINSLWAGAEGLLADWSDRDPAGWPGEEVWWEEHAQNSLENLQEVIWKSQRAVAGPPQPLTFCIVTHLHEAAGRQLWPLVLRAVRGAQLPFADYQITLIAATDTAAILNMPDDEVAAIGQNMSLLSAELQSDIEAVARAGAISHCYLQDTRDTHVYTLRELRADDCIPDLQTLQVHQIVEFLCQLSAGLNLNKVYQDNNLQRLRIDLDRQIEGAWIGSFAAGSCMLPVGRQTDQVTNNIGRRMLSKVVLGEPDSGHGPAVRRLSAGWRQKTPLGQTDMQHHITHDRGGNQFSFTLDLPNLDGIPDFWLLDQLTNWDVLMSKKWTAAGAAPEQVRRQATGLSQEIRDEIDSVFNDMLQSQPEGVQLAAMLAEEMNIQLQVAQAEPGLKAAKDHWLTWLLAALRIPPADRYSEPDLQVFRDKLSATLRRRVIPRAAWLRAAVMSCVLLAFTWAAVSASGSPTAVITNILDPVSSWVARGGETGLLLAVLICAMAIAFFMGGWTIWRTERGIVRAIDSLIQATQQKYQVRLQKVIREEQNRIYNECRQAVASWHERVLAREKILDEALRLLEEGAVVNNALGYLLTERLLAVEVELTANIPRPLSGEIQDWGLRFLNSADRSPWDEEGVEEIVRGCREIASGQIKPWREQHSISSWIAGNGDTVQWGEIFNKFDTRVRPALPLSREDRAVLSMRQPGRISAGNNGRLDSRPLVVTRHVGLTAVEDLAGAGEFIANHDAIYYSGDPERITYAAIIQAADLQHLRLWPILQRNTIVEEITV